jgi:2-polyprenyl-6-methoxyphenol hydroxylase-like FAD-dependent oxidoreductase
MNIACVGGGPAGLHFATVMKQFDRNCSVTVYERQPPDATDGWGVVFWDDLLEQLRTTDADIARAIHDASLRWGSQALERGGRRTERRSRGGGGYSIGRRRLLQVLSERASAVGVQLEYGREIARPSELPEADVIVAADGAGSQLRHAHASRFGTRIADGINPYIWLGTPRLFDGFTFSLVRTNSGWIWFHGYPFSSDLSTCVVECSPAAWADLGFDRLDVGTAVLRLSELFATSLDGQPLWTGDSTWGTFRTVTNTHWHHENVVLVGDAAHTTHFTIGSGTRLALGDAISLARHLQSHSDHDEAFNGYERERQAALVQPQSEASFSARWFESIDRYVDLPDDQLFTLLRERRSPLLARIPPRWYYGLHRATERFQTAERLRNWVGPRARSAYSRRFG